MLSLLFPLYVCPLTDPDCFSDSIHTFSHRLSTTVQADKIYVMEQGRIIESGSHSELMAADGIYAYMFRLQAEKYKNAKSE